MAKPFAKHFYNSKQWKNCRDTYKESVHGLCEECYSNGIIKPGDEVHHIIPLTPDNITDPKVALSWDNLILLCHDCHMREHEQTRAQGLQDHYRKIKKQTPRRYRFDAYGHVINRPDDF